jgi:hypothetical protein
MDYSDDYSGDYSDDYYYDNEQMDSPGRTYEFFINLLNVPYSVVSFLYILALFLISFVVAATKIAKYSKCCRNIKCSHGNQVADLVTKFNRWLVKFVLGIGEDKQVDEEESEADRKKVHIQGCKIEDQDINILGIIVICFGLLLGIAAFDVFLLEVSVGCSNDQSTFCYLGAVDPDDPRNPLVTELEANYPITDCSKWEHPNISELVTFICFKYAYDCPKALATAGGLITLFTVALRITVTVLLKVFKVLKPCGKIIAVIQVTTVILLLVCDATITGLVVGYQITTVNVELTPVTEQFAEYLIKNLLQILVIMGTVTLLLLIPWTKYSKKRKQYKLEEML